MSYRKILLPNGLRVLCEEIPHFHTASIGIWVQNGSRHEPARLSGISHFIEHMVFKGTEDMPSAICCFAPHFGRRISNVSAG